MGIHCFDKCSESSFDSFNNVSESDVLRYINSLKSTSTGYDNINSRSILIVKNVKSKHLAFLINLCFTTGTFPDQLKIARLKIIYKKGDKNDVSNYRPISILNNFSKIFEKAILDQIYNFTNTQLCPYQFGFRKNSSCEHALLTIKEKILQQLENNNYVLGIIIDFIKAFDCIDHEILLFKLQHYGFRSKAFNLLSTYLKNRTQFVQIQEFNSEFCEIKQGVPQGSILGPILFIVYVNDIFNCLNMSLNNVSITQYADDTTIICNNIVLDDLCTLANSVMIKLKNWCCINRMLINCSKTNCILFGFHNSNMRLPEIYYNGTILNYVSNIKILGVYFDQRLSFSTHIMELRKQLCYKLSLLRKAKSMLPLKVKLNFYYAHFYSMFIYCLLVWGTASRHHLNLLLLIQKAVLRIIYNVPFNFHTETLFAQSQIIKVNKLYYYKLGVELKKLNSNFMTLFTLKTTVSNYPLRQHSFYTLPKCSLSVSASSLDTTVPKILNIFHRENLILFRLSWAELKSRLKEIEL